MSRRIAIVGAGQSGALLALALRRDGHDVTLATDRTADEVRSGPVMSSQCLFGTALAIEEELAADSRASTIETAPTIDTMVITIPGTDGSPLQVIGKLDDKAQSLDQRVKCAEWIDTFVAIGGRLRVGEVDRAGLEQLAADHELTVVATGKGALSGIFDTDRTRTRFATPQRISSMAYVHGMAADECGAQLSMTAVAGVGECLTMPALTTTGPCEIILLEAVPGGPMDTPEVSDDPAERLRGILKALDEHFPVVARRSVSVTLTDDSATLHGSVTPTVRKPVATLCDGSQVLGMADVVVLNDPVTGQGSNNAVHAAHTYYQAITARGDGAFDADWMRRTFEKYWRGWGQWSVAWTNSMLGGIPAHVGTVFTEAEGLGTLADAVVRGFDDPRTVSGWWFSAADAAELVASARTEARSALDRRELRNALGQYATGVTVITALAPDGRKVGITANSFTSVSLDPPLVSFCPARSAPSLPDFSAAGRFAVHVLAADQHDLSRQFATPAADKFAGVEHVQSADGTPLLERVVARFECRTVARVDAGDHVIFLGEIETFDAPGGEPLVFHSGRYRLVATHPDHDG